MLEQGTMADLGLLVPKIGAAAANHFPTLFHELVVKVKIMQTIQLRRKNLSGHIEVAQIGAGKIPAGVAFTCLVQRSRITGEVRPLDVDSPTRRKQRTVARVACRN